MFVTTNEGGMAFAFPDVCLTPPFAIPVPYPNFASLSDGQGSSRVLIRGAQVLREGDEILTSTGNEPGCMPGGVVTGVIKGKAVLLQGWSTVLVEGSPVSYLGVPTGQNTPGGAMNIVGGVVAVAQSKVVLSGGGGSGGVSVTKPPSEQETRDALEWAKKVSALVPKKAADRRAQAKNEENVRGREKLAEMLNRVILRGDDVAKLTITDVLSELGHRVQTIPERDLLRVVNGQAEPPAVSRERLQDAYVGAPGIGRIPLTFPTRADFLEFQKELREVFEAEGITDATVIQLGSATTGWKGNPGKPIAPWTKESDADIDIFSPQALAQAHAHGCPINPKLTQHGKFLFVEHHTADGKGFYDTPIGKRLETLAKRWNQKLYGDAEAEGFKFYLHLHPNWKGLRQMADSIPLMEAR